jgi:hypothetical protein
MHPIFHDELNKARIAELHHRAERVRLARTSAQTRRAPRDFGKDRAGATVFARCLQIIVGARSA